MATSTQKKAHRKPTTEEILNVLEGKVRTSRFSVVYLGGLFVVACAMIILPVIYLGMIAGVVYLMYYHATHATGILEPVGYGSRWRMLLYITPFLVGTILLVFMLKPLFSRDRRKATGMVIDANNEPLLPAYVEKLCRSMGAPVPREIIVDCQINAAAGIKHGVFGRSTTLVIGMPLVAHLTLRELTGVLAHEFGHFTQRVGMRFSYVILSINAWFYRVVHKRDHWDEKLLESSDAGNYITLVVWAARFMIWLIRRVLWLLMLVGHMISCYMSRQMEYAADRCEGLVAGSEVFGRTMQKLTQLSVANQMAHSQLRGFWLERRLVDDLPALITRQVKLIPKELLKVIEKGQAKAATKLFSTHPSASERTRRVELLNAKGIVRRDGPARLLFQNFEVVAKAATLVHYREMISRHIGAENLISGKQMLQEQEEAERESEAIEEYLGHDIYVCRPVFFDDPFIKPTKDPEATVKRLKDAHQRIGKAISKIAQVYKRYDEAEDGLISSAQASALIRAGVDFDHKEFKIRAKTLDAVDEARLRHETVKRREGDLLLPYEKVLRMRLTCALQLLDAPEVAKRIEDAERLLRDGQRVVAVTARLRDIFDRFNRMRIDYETTGVLFRAVQFDPENHALIEMVQSRLRDMTELVRDCRSELRDMEYPFEHASGKISIAQYAVDYVPGGDDFAEAIDAITTFVNNMTALYVRCLGRIADIARKVEKVVGLQAFKIEQEDGTQPPESSA